MSTFLKSSGFKKAAISAGAVLAAALVIFFAGNSIMKTAVSAGISKAAGTPAHIEKFSLDIFKSSLRMGGFKLYNPKGFPGGVLLDAPLIRVDYVPSSFFRKEPHMRLIEVNLKELAVIKGNDGKLNIDSLKPCQKKTTQPKEEKPAQEPMKLRIDTLVLSVGRVVYKDYTKGTEPFVQVFDVDMEGKTFTNIDNMQKLMALILVEAMKPTAIRGAAVCGAAAMAGIGLISKQKVKQILSQTFLYKRNLLSPTIVSDTGNSLNSGDFVPFLK